MEDEIKAEKKIYKEKQTEKTVRKRRKRKK